MLIGPFGLFLHVLCSDDRITVRTSDVNELLIDKEFREEYRGKIGLIHADIPFGYFKNDHADVPWTQAVATLVATATKDLCTDSGTLLLKMSDHDADMWRTSLQQAGWFVKRDRVVLCQAAPWMRRKAFLSHAECVNPFHFWMIAHAHPRDYYEASKPFGK